MFEAAGIATVTLGSIRAQLYNTAPPRGLFCDFPLGRPVGKPNDAAFQHDVLRHAFSLLAAPDAVIEDYPTVIGDDVGEALVCSLPPRFDSGVHPAVDEARGIRSAYDRAVAKFGDRAGAAPADAGDDVDHPRPLLAHLGLGDALILQRSWAPTSTG